MTLVLLVILILLLVGALPQWPYARWDYTPSGAIAPMTNPLTSTVMPISWGVACRPFCRKNGGRGHFLTEKPPTKGYGAPAQDSPLIP